MTMRLLSWLGGLSLGMGLMIAVNSISGVSIHEGLGFLGIFGGALVSIGAIYASDLPSLGEAEGEE